MTSWGSVSFQDANSSVMEEFGLFHSFLGVVLGGIMALVMLVLAFTLLSSFTSSKMTEHQFLEWVWTFFPGMILISIAIPSIDNLYLMDEWSDWPVLMKVVGHQWYWSFEFSTGDLVQCSDLFMISEGPDPWFRLLDTDVPISIPTNTPVQMSATSTDVIHSWALPSAGVKGDCVPGRVNSLTVNMSRAGAYYGQCSEICGINHSFMPIMVHSIPMSEFVPMSI